MSPLDGHERLAKVHYGSHRSGTTSTAGILTPKLLLCESALLRREQLAGFNEDHSIYLQFCAKYLEPAQLCSRWTSTRAVP
jgi:hypothetical protein